MGQGDDALLVRYQPTGRRLWAKTLEGRSIGTDRFDVVQLWGSRSVFAGGVVTTQPGGMGQLATRYAR